MAVTTDVKPGHATQPESDPVTADARLIHPTTSLCNQCQTAIPARVVEHQGQAWMIKHCGVHGEQALLISPDAQWYQDQRRHIPAARAGYDHHPVEWGCPYDCGLCRNHLQEIKLPIVTITSACNLQCPICYVHNKNRNAYEITVAAFTRIIENLKHDNPDLDIINLTGGDPTLHANLPQLIDICRDAGIHRISICTNGIVLVQQPALAARLADMGVRIALSFDSFQNDVDYHMQGANLLNIKMRCLDLLQELGMNTTLIPVMAQGLNDHEIGRMIELMLERDNIRHLEVHTMTYTGPGGISFDRRHRISMIEVLQAIESHSDGLLRTADFVPSPCAHPLCYQVAYLLLDPDGGEPVPFTRIFSRETLYDCMSEHLYMEPSAKLEQAFRGAIDRLWMDEDPQNERILAIIKKLLKHIYPADRAISRSEALRRSERIIKAVFVHSHMDAENFDVERLAHCCDCNFYDDGGGIPICAYNVLYRDKDARFMEQPVLWADRSGGMKDLKP